MNTRLRQLVGVIGAGDPDQPTAQAAHEVGRLLAEKGCSIINGALGGVMEAATRGFREGASSLLADKRGIAIGISPDATSKGANEFLDYVIPSGFGETRNVLIVNASTVLIAIGGEFGTLTEVGFGLKRGVPVISLGSWEVHSSVTRAATPSDAVELALKHLSS
jgi:uncharacterized protein (TIGR00725 family)